MGSTMSTSKAVVPVDTLTEARTSKSTKEKPPKRTSSWKTMMNKRSKKVQPVDNNLEDSQSRTKSSEKLHITHDQSTGASSGVTSAVRQAPVTDSHEAPGTPRTVADQASDTHEPEMIQATTGQLLWCLGEYLCRRCPLIQDLSPMDLVMWLRLVDLHLLHYQYQRDSCIQPSSVVFLYMLCRKAVSSELATSEQLRAVVLTCMYTTCSYMGGEIGYPAKPFLKESSKEAFWKRTIAIAMEHSGEMLRINTDPNFYFQMFADLKNQHQEEDLFTCYTSQ